MAKFIYWEGWPALLGKTEAKALLDKGAKEWTNVDVDDVRNVGGICNEKEWREMFKAWGPAMDKLPKVN